MSAGSSPSFRSYAPKEVQSLHCFSSTKRGTRCERNGHSSGLSKQHMLDVALVPCEPRCTPIESPVSLVLRTQHNPYNHQSMSQWNSMNWGARPYIQTKPCYNMLQPWRLTWYKNGTSVAAALVFSAPKHRTPPVVSGARNTQGSPFRWSRWQVDGPWDHQSNSYQWGLWVYSWREANPD
jgi:hypothetical protein